MFEPLILSLDDDSLAYIDNTNAAFDGTKYANFQFKIFYKRLTRTQEFAIEKKHTKRGKKGPVVNEPAVNAEKFRKSVVGWENIKAKMTPGQSEIELECNDANKDIISEKASKFANLIMLAILNEETGLLDEAPMYDDSEEFSDGGEILHENF